MGNVYQYPQYYEIAFSYRNIPREVDVLEQAIRMFSKIPVHSMLEIACGNSPHMPELLKRGYTYSGLDLSPEMLSYSQQKAENLGYSVKLFNANLADFQIPEPVDFAYTMLGSLYVQSTAELLSHFNSIEGSLKPGGLYFLDWCVDFSPLHNSKDSWSIRRNGIRVDVHYATKLLNPVDQHYEETLHLTVRDGKDRRKMNHKGLRRAIYPQEFLLASTKLHHFEFLGWWNDWNFNLPLEKVAGRNIIRPIAILRKI